jgi:hypothetical protein
VRTTLERLHRRGLLRREVPGRPGAEPSRRRADLYRLPDADARANAYQYRETRSMGPPAQTYGTPPPAGTGTPAAPGQIYGTPTPTPGTDAAPAALTVTLQAADIDALTAALDALRHHPGITLPPEPAAPARLRVLPAAPDGTAAGLRRSA